MAKIMHPDFSPRSAMDGMAQAGRVELFAEGNAVEGESNLRQDGNVSRLPGLGVRKANHVTAQIFWFQSHQFPFSKPRKR